MGAAPLAAPRVSASGFAGAKRDQSDA